MVSQKEKYTWRLSCPKANSKMHTSLLPGPLRRQFVDGRLSEPQQRQSLEWRARTCGPADLLTPKSSFCLQSIVRNLRCADSTLAACCVSYGLPAAYTTGSQRVSPCSDESDQPVAWWFSACASLLVGLEFDSRPCLTETLYIGTVAFLPVCGIVAGAIQS